MSMGRASFMLNTVVVPSDTTRPESPIGPSAGARSAMIMTSRLPVGSGACGAISMPAPEIRCLTESVVSKNFVKPRASSSRFRSGTG